MYLLTYFQVDATDQTVEKVDGNANKESYLQVDTKKYSTYQTVKKIDENANKESQLAQEVEVVEIDI